MWRGLLGALLALRAAEAGVYDAPNTLPNRQTLVHLFEWKWTDIANECEQFLQHNGYGAVQVSPPMEHVVMEKFGDRPWWIRYQPISYKLISRSGNRAQFADMVRRCNAVGVRIIVDAVLNHMTATDLVSSATVTTSAGSWFRGISGAELFPNVPYTSSNQFHDRFCGGCDPYCNIPAAAFTSNAWQVRMCRLGLLDLDQSNEYVSAKIAAYLNDLISLGVAGFRVDAERHMWPADLTYLYGRLNNLRTDVFGPGQRPFVVGEVTGDPRTDVSTGNDYIGCCGRVTNFQYGADVQAAITGARSWSSLANSGPGAEFGWASHDVLAFIDNHDNQRHGGRLSYKNGLAYEMAVAYMLAWNYGLARVMSSFYFASFDQGPPSTGPPNFATTSPVFTPDGHCAKSSGWVCEHRWPAIRRMVTFRSQVTGTGVSGMVTWSSGLAFQRTGKGFFALNNGSSAQSRKWSTGLPAGTYCDVISGQVVGAYCSGVGVHIAADGTGTFAVSHGAFALHIGQRIGGTPSTTTNGPTVPVTTTRANLPTTTTTGAPPPTTTSTTPPPPPPTTSTTTTGAPPPTTSSTTTKPPPPTTSTTQPPPPTTSTTTPFPTPKPSSMKLTAIFLENNVGPGTDLFIRGGISEEYYGPSKCHINQLAGSPCSISIVHNATAPKTFTTYLDWEKGDNYLDWWGPEPNQGEHNGMVANGSPLLWTTSNPSVTGYQKINTFGPNYWLLLAYMDCSKTINGMFAFKGIQDGALSGEPTDFTQTACGGSLGPSSTPYPHGGKYHYARCGALNVFHWGKADCTIDALVAP